MLTPCIGQLGNPLEDKRILRGRGIVFEAGVSILLQAGGGFARPFGEAAACQRTVRRERNAVFPAEGHHFPLLLPEE